MSRLQEFSTGTGNGVLVDGARLHKSLDCPKVTAKVATYPTVRTARAAVPHLKACTHC